MWLGHFIEHLMCIGGELVHPNALPSPAREKQSTGVLCSRARGIYRHLIGPGSWHEPRLKGSLWSRFKPPTGTNGGGPGARPIGPGSSHEPGPINCLYIPLAREQSTLTALFFVAGEERALWCSSSPPMHMRCSMKCPSHTS